MAALAVVAMSTESKLIFATNNLGEAAALIWINHSALKLAYISRQAYCLRNRSIATDVVRCNGGVAELGDCAHLNSQRQAMLGPPLER
jgi:hypothetical protein